MKNYLLLLFLVTTMMCHGEAITIATEHLARWEGFRSEAYRPTKYDKLTIGYGFTDKALVSKKTMSKAEARKILEIKVKAQAAYVDKVVKVKLTAKQKAALIVFSYNVGNTAFKNSTLVKVLNEGKYHQVPLEISRWNKETYTENGVKKVRVLRGLTNRRNSEIKLWKD